MTPSQTATLQAYLPEAPPLKFLVGRMGRMGPEFLRDGQRAGSVVVAGREVNTYERIRFTRVGDLGFSVFHEKLALLEHEHSVLTRQALDGKSSEKHFLISVQLTVAVVE